MAIQKTVKHFTNWLPTIENIDALKAEGCWNNDWALSMELIHRHKKSSKKDLDYEKPSQKLLIEVFNDFYFGGDPNGDPRQWKGLIQNEPLIVKKDFFEKLSQMGFSWGFVSGAERSSAKYVLESRLNLLHPPLIAMGDAPDKPNPHGLITLASKLAGTQLGEGVPTVIYVGDTIADILTVKKAKKKNPGQIFLSIGIAPPHLHTKENKKRRVGYEKMLKEAGADVILPTTEKVLEFALTYS